LTVGQISLAKSFFHVKKDLCIHDCSSRLRGEAFFCSGRAGWGRPRGYINSFQAHCSSTCAIINSERTAATIKIAFFDPSILQTSQYSISSFLLALSLAAGMSAVAHGVGVME